MISLFETILEVLSLPLEKWDTLRTKYKVILLAIFLFCVIGIILYLTNDVLGELNDSQTIDKQ